MCRLLLACTMDPVNLNSIGQVVFEYQAFEVLNSIKSMKFTSQNNATTLKPVYEICYK